VLFAAIDLAAQTALRVGWFGNSYSEAGRQYAMLPKMINCTSECGVPSTDMTVEVTPYISPSCWLDCHETQWPAFAVIAAEGYDLVYAQDGTTGWFPPSIWYAQWAVPKADQYTRWAEEARSAGGRLIIPQLWIATTDPTPTDLTQATSDWWFDSLARETNSILVPAGHAWWYARKERPDLEYIDPGWNDGSHPGAFGAYLTLCCQYAAITGLSPVGSTWHKVWMGDTITIPEDEALFAQQKAWEAYLYFSDPTPARDRQAETRAAGSGPVAARYSSATRTLSATGAAISDVRVVGLDGKHIPADIVDSHRAVLKSTPAAGVFLVRARYGSRRQTVTVKVGP
jgi:hypothetical protein